jgi:hypothetical protein
LDLLIEDLMCNRHSETQADFKRSKINLKNSKKLPNVKLLNKQGLKSQLETSLFYFCYQQSNSLPPYMVHYGFNWAHKVVA